MVAEAKMRDPLLKLVQVAELLCVSRSTVSRWVAAGKLRAVRRPSGQPAVRLSVVEAAMGN